MTKLRFKPAFNPYTEPSIEIFAYHPMLKKWVEVGNSGMFRPEMLRPMAGAQGPWVRRSSITLFARSVPPPL